MNWFDSPFGGGTRGRILPTKSNFYKLFVHQIIDYNEFAKSKIKKRPGNLNIYQNKLILHYDFFR